MNINGINASNTLSGLGSSEGASGVSSANQTGDDGFGSLIKGAVESIGESQKSADGEIAKAVAGESPDLHKTIIALQTADLKFQLGLQVRNKLIGAYEEIMRMQV